MTNRVKTIVVIDSMSVGGIATSLYNFLNHTSQWLDCDLLVFDPESVDPERIPEHIRIVPCRDSLKMLGVCQREYIKKHPVPGLYRAALVLLARITSGEFARKILFATSKKISGYELAISFAHDNGWKSLSKGCNDFVVNKVEAKCKVGFIHCDYANYGGYDSRQEKMLSRLDAISCVSESCKANFAAMFPNLRKKCVVCENFTDIERIEKRAEPAIAYPSESVNFVTVCRLGEEKGLYRTVEAFSELLRAGYQNFSWTVVGDGPEKEKLMQAIMDNGLTEKISFVGEKKNPYPYIKNASVFLLPSIHEAAPMVFGESMAMGVPVLTTNTCSALELVQERHCGIVVENSCDGIKRGIQKILEHPELLEGITISPERINEHARDQAIALARMARDTLA